MALKNKVLTLLCIATMVLSLTACGNAGNNSGANTGSGTNEAGSSVTPNNTPMDAVSALEAQIVGRWQSYYRVGDDGETVHVAQPEDVTNHYYVEYYSDGTGKTNCYISGDEDDFVVFRWEVTEEKYDPGVYCVYDYIALEPSSEEEQDTNGYYVTTSVFGDTIDAETKLDENGNTVVTASLFRNDFVRMDDYDFKDEGQPAGYEKAFASIDAYRTDKKAYKAQFEE